MSEASLQIPQEVNGVIHDACKALYPWHRPEDITRYPWYMTRDIATVISWVIYHGYLRISRLNSLKTQ